MHRDNKEPFYISQQYVVLTDFLKVVCNVDPHSNTEVFCKCNKTSSDGSQFEVTDDIATSINPENSLLPISMSDIPCSIKILTSGVCKLEEKKSSFVSLFAAMAFILQRKDL